MSTRIGAAVRGIAVGVGLSMAVVACVAPPDRSRVVAGGASEVACTEPRPELCVTEYRPVCARLGAGTNAPWKTFSSGCSACSDARVTVYRPGGACR